MKSEEGRAGVGRSPGKEGNKKQSRKNPGVGSGHRALQAELRLGWKRLPGAGGGVGEAEAPPESLSLLTALLQIPPRLPSLVTYPQIPGSHHSTCLPGP